MTLVEELMRQFPWLSQIGLSVQFFRDLAATVTTEDELVAEIRQTSQWQARFPGIFRADGTMRGTEAQYLSTEEDYRKLMKQYGRAGYEYDNPADFKVWFDNEVDPNELSKRLQVYTDIQASGQATKDAFYVYAGLRVTDDDLYAAAVNPSYRQQLEQAYGTAAMASPPTWEDFVARSTEVALQRIAKLVGDSQFLTTEARQKVLAMDPEFARNLVDVLGQGDGKPMALDELLRSFEYAVVGSSATAKGLGLPTKERVAAIRAAGVDRAAADRAYSQFAQDRNLLDAQVRRATGHAFTQDDFEKAMFLSDPDAAADLAKGIGLEKALGTKGGSPSFGQNRAGQLQQLGLR